MSHHEATFRTLFTYWLPVVLWMGVIFWFSAQSSLPSSPDPLIEIITKKTAHGAEYAILALLLLRAFTHGRSFSVRGALLAWVVVVIYAASDEIHQSLTPNRNPSPLDVLIDITGGMLALLIVGRWGRALGKLTAKLVELRP
jgi:VanZ family protein